MTDQQKLTLAIQNEIHRCDMRELALNSLRFNAWRRFESTGRDDVKDLDAMIIASIPDDYGMFPKQISGTSEPNFPHDV